MVATKEQRLRDLPACLIEFEITCGIVELLMLDDERLRVAQISEDIIVEEEAALVHAFFLLALATHAQDRLEPLQLLHLICDFLSLLFEFV